MKKSLSKFIQVLIVALFFAAPVSFKAQTLGFSINANSDTICSVGSTNNQSGQYFVNCIFTSTISGASYYTFTVSSGASVFFISQNMPNYSVGVWAPSPGVYTITGLAYASTSNSVVMGSATQTFMVIQGPQVTVSGPMQVCPNSTNSYTASGGSTYTWTGANFVTSTGAIASLGATSSSAIFTISATAANGCSNTTVFTPTVGTTNVTVSQNTICAGQTATLTASGASTYTWSNGSNASSIVVSPSVTTAYTLIANNGNCTASSVHWIAVNGLPNVSVSGSQNICAGSSAQLTASGANSYVWSNNAGGSSIMVSPSVPTCYTVTGNNGPNCSSSAVVCVSVTPAPSISASGSGLVCYGSSITFTASGGTTYTWSTGATTSTMNVIPVSSAVYTVAGSWATNMCTGVAIVSVNVNQGCAIVWPGDANSDGVADNSDVLELGLAANSTGAARSATSNAWAGQMATTWSGTLSTGANQVHADCNGDGVVNSNDATAISLNFAQTHTFKSSATGNDISLTLTQNSAAPGQWVKADVMLGDATNNLTQLYGVAFDVNYDQNLIEPDSVKIIYSSSFLKGSNQTIDFGKTVFANAKLYGATVRTDQTNVSGNGKIGELWIKISSTASANSIINLSVSNAKMISNAGIQSPLAAANPVNLTVANTVGVQKITNGAISIRSFPNPATNMITLENNNVELVSYSFIDITGREVKSGSFAGQSDLDISELSAGTYIIKFSSAAGQSVTKMAIAK